ncbi:hydrolase [Lonsdalea populi]|uniref:Hydrolase n=3 Tax=Pectobacteriaceae TaxID=1903410 RepID=A0ACD1J986_9GAMM|nr:hydrolase [Lonsdalea populi]RAT11566.1 hydrolase [Lonsdalea quercina]RAT18210.1 hydrolase [Lonsdalea populi]RAT22132.1 hydrolase [Lonsdalea populi]RAT26628.1 hydrolase [Lonsdalea populi]
MNIHPTTSQMFRPLASMYNPHLQTLLPRLLRRRALLKPLWQTLELPDGDFLDLAWSEDPMLARDKPRVVLFHGLEGSFYSPYAHGLVAACHQRGWLAVVMHFRGCGGTPNRTPQMYHSGETEDARYFLRWLKSTYGDAPTAAIGVSLGGNMLACLLGQQTEEPLLDAAAVVSAPLMLEPCCRHIEKGFSRFYQHYLLRLLKRNAIRKLAAYPDTLPVHLHQLRKIRGLREFDNMITARIHGFTDANDYYARSSALPLLPNVRTPLLIVHAKDDPFMTKDVIPALTSLPPNIEYQLTKHGGHVGFVGGSLLKPKLWLEQRIPDWLTPHLER